MIWHILAMGRLQSYAEDDDQANVDSATCRHISSSPSPSDQNVHGRHVKSQDWTFTIFISSRSRFHVITVRVPMKGSHGTARGCPLCYASNGHENLYGSSSRYIQMQTLQSKSDDVKGSACLFTLKH
ncbi:hypothetical protein N7G274_005066 [Stereocaulon virgatum]|uniref:Uncharacterized protein n=1 Tax=Stereocaulon virgatum TaxID=373712 RepID=A0ABR4A7J5_9LECA